ncbi:MAG: hypothetical protein IJR66_05790 [Clostridia bacterium]|nr:hypothetical protein [Clostridia bacterium]
MKKQYLPLELSINEFSVKNVVLASGNADNLDADNLAKLNSFDDNNIEFRNN